MSPVNLFHICTAHEWAAAQRAGEIRPASLDTEGFVHCSYAEQVAGTLAKHFAGASDLVVIELDPQRLGAEIRVEDSYGSGTAFPHVYGPIPLDAVVAGPQPGAIAAVQR